jgi:hypothetical protein
VIAQFKHILDVDVTTHCLRSDRLSDDVAGRRSQKIASQGVGVGRSLIADPKPVQGWADLRQFLKCLSNRFHCNWTCSGSRRDKPEQEFAGPLLI